MIAAEIISYMDTNVHPCHDFYQFVCGNFEKNAVIRNEEATNRSISRLQDNLRTQLKSTLEKNFGPNDLEVFKKVRAYYDVCMNEGKSGLTTVL